MLRQERKLYVGKAPLHQIRKGNEERVVQIMPLLFE